MSERKRNVGLEHVLTSNSRSLQTGLSARSAVMISVTSGCGAIRTGSFFWSFKPEVHSFGSVTVSDDPPVVCRRRISMTVPYPYLHGRISIVLPSPRAVSYTHLE